MSNSRETKHFCNMEEKIKKNSQFNDGKLISYIESVKNEDLYEWMKKGYEEMASINLQYAEEACSLGLHDELEYETWLCGV